MKKFVTQKDVEEELLAHAPLKMMPADYKLTRPKILLETLGNPQDQLKVIHVAGTSGKTSTAYYVRGLLEVAGKRTGLTVSPHISSITERLQIDGEPMPEEKFVAYFEEFYAQVADVTPRPTFFELLTAFAYWVFAKEQVDYAVVEVGLGGRYDATNVVTRRDKVSVISSIGYDHTEILGETLTEIAGEKVGIIGEACAVFTVQQDPEAMRVIEAESSKQQADLHVVTPGYDAAISAPIYQQQNFSLALSAVQYVAARDGFRLQGTEIVLEDTVVPGRFELYQINGKTLLLDGAHNPQKLRALLADLQAKHIQPAAFVVAFSEAPEKKLRECIQLVTEFADSVRYTEFVIQRDVLRRSADVGMQPFFASPEDALRDALSSQAPFVVVTGSLYLVATLRPFVQQLAASVSAPSLLH